MNILVYLAGEIHSGWTKAIIDACSSAGLSISFMSPISDQEKSDGVGTDILGEETSEFWKDHKSAKINAIRTKIMIEKADVVIAKFGEKYRQWNTAFDVGYAAAMAVADSPEQVAGILQYVVTRQDKIDS